MAGLQFTSSGESLDNERGTAALMRGWQVQLNLIRDHPSLGTTPGLAAGLPDFTASVRGRFSISRLRAEELGPTWEATDRPLSGQHRESVSLKYKCIFTATDSRVVPRRN